MSEKMGNRHPPIVRKTAVEVHQVQHSYETNTEEGMLF